MTIIIKTEECASSNSFLNRPLPRKKKSLIKVKKERASAGEVEPVPKRMRHSSTEIVLVIGGNEFLEDSHELACSKYIENRVQRGIRRIHIGGKKDPSEWAMVRKLLEQFSVTPLNKENLRIALPWFKELQIDKGMAQCDQILAGKVVTVDLPLKRSNYTNEHLQMKADDMERVLDALPLSISYDLPESKSKCFEIVRQVMKEGPFWLDLELITKIVSLVSIHDECKKELLDSLKDNVPSAASSNMDEMLSNALLPVLILSSFEGKEKAREVKRTTNRMFGIIAGLEPKTRVAGLKKALKKDKICRKILPEKW